MKTRTKVCLGISITGFVVGATTNFAWGLGLPVGAIFFGWFLMMKLLEKEVDKFDQEQAWHQVGDFSSHEVQPEVEGLTHAHA